MDFERARAELLRTMPWLDAPEFQVMLNAAARLAASNQAGLDSFLTDAGAYHPPLTPAAADTVADLIDVGVLPEEPVPADGGLLGEFMERRKHGL